ncbi:MAG TPA: helix-turn-helix domain-containing protein, partial [Euzebya sp.]|nr:helix-turn-helix domain-containing protein [Euzebya sp.]
MTRAAWAMHEMALLDVPSGTGQDGGSTVAAGTPQSSRSVMSTIQSVERAFAVLDVVAGGASGITEIAAQASLPKSTVARLLATLETLQAVERIDEGTEYRIGPRVVEMAGPLEAHAYLATAVHPHLERLS